MQEDESIFNPSLSQMSCREIFYSVSDALGEYYKDKGLTYSPSYPKLVYKDAQLKLEICFWSSHSNISEDYVCFEVLPAIYSVKHKNVGNKGLICGHTDIFRQPQKQKYNFNVCKLSVEEFNNITTLIDSIILPWIKKLKTPDGISEMLQIKEEAYKGNSVFLEYVQLYYPKLVIK